MTLRRIIGKLLVKRLVPLFAEIGVNVPENVAQFYALTLDAFRSLIAMKPEMITQDKILAIIEELLINCTGEKDD